MPHVKLSEKQLDEISRLAVSQVQADNWDNLPWDSAWSGEYPSKPSQAHIESEFESLKAKALRILSGDLDLEQEYSDLEEHRRMIALESCVTFDIWNPSNLSANSE